MSIILNKFAGTNCASMRYKNVRQKKYKILAAMKVEKW